MKNTAKFIVTTDKETADKLKTESFRLVSDANGKYTFEIKSGNMSFDKIDKKKVAYTNILSL